MRLPVGRMLRQCTPHRKQRARPCSGGSIVFRRSIRFIIRAAILASAVAAGNAQQPQSASASQDFTFALVGDAIITRKLSVYAEPAFTRVIDLIRNADAAFVNL